MPHSQSQTNPRDLLKLLATYPLRWLVPMVGVAAIAYAYAQVRPAVWEASQALTVRDEAAASTDHPGKFRVVDDMKTVQDTILELAKSRTVLEAALKQVGPPAGCTDSAAWPTAADVTALQGNVKLSPPHGAEFGKTEVFYLLVQSTDSQRAVALASAVSDQLKSRYEQLRDAKAQSMIDEVSKTVGLAQTNLQTATARMAEMDATVGPDLGELRTLIDTSSGDSPLRRSISEMETELRTAQAVTQANEELLKLLVASKNDPNCLLAAPSRLLDTQPALRRLKDGLVDAQLHTSVLLGNMSAEHPLVAAAKVSEQEITGHLREELNASIRSVEVELRLSTERTATIDQQLAVARGRLSRLAGIRAEYGNVADAVRRRTETLKAAETQLTEARASEAGSHTASLISRIDSPEAGTSPIGPGRSLIVLGGTAGGLLIGLGLLFLTVAPSKSADEPSESPLASFQPTSNGKGTTLNGSLSFKQALTKITADSRRR